MMIIGFRKIKKLIRFGLEKGGNGWRLIKNMSRKKKLIVAGLSIVILSAAFILAWMKINEAGEPKQVYEVAVMVRSQENPDPAEDARTSLKAGDVIVVQKDGHSWSTTEKVSYLILKLELTEEQASKLTKAKEREMTKAERKAEEEKRIDQGREMPKEEKARMKNELENRKITVLARGYRIKLEAFPGFDPMRLLNGQPFLNNIYDWKIVEKK